VVTFVDTSAIYAYLDEGDANHAAASRTLFDLLDRGARLVTHNYVVVEASALVQRRLGTIASRALHDDLLSVLEIVWIDESTHAQAVEAMLAADRRSISLVDWTSFVVIRQRRIDEALTFDADFRERGWAVLPD
jgi:predicted nucleic acid-binding protein